MASPERNKTMTLLAEWSGKTGRPINDLLTMVNKNIELLQNTSPGKSPDWYERRARFMTYRELKTQLRYPGLMTIDGIFFGYGSAMDVFARRRTQALNLFATNPKEAIDGGWTRPDGTPIYKLPSGSVIPIANPVMLRSSIGLTRPATGGDMKLTILVHRMDQVNNLPPIGKPVRMSVRRTEESPIRDAYNTTRLTKYEPINMPEFPTTLDDGALCDLLLKAPPELRTTCSGLMDWHTKHASDVRRVCILEGDVVFLRSEPIVSTGNYLMILEDETIMSLEAEGITVWIPGELGHLLTFGTGSRVVIAGRSAAMPGYNRETRTVDRSVTRPGLNAFAIFAEPEFRIPAEEATLIEAEGVS